MENSNIVVNICAIGQNRAKNAAIRFHLTGFSMYTQNVHTKPNVNEFIGNLYEFSTESIITVVWHLRTPTGFCHGAQAQFNLKCVLYTLNKHSTMMRTNGSQFSLIFYLNSKEILFDSFWIFKFHSKSSWDFPFDQYGWCWDWHNCWKEERGLKGWAR